MGRHYAIVLAGGRSARMGIDKTRLLLEGHTLLERAVQACVGVERIIVAGPAVVLDPPHPLVEFVLEDPPYSGPVAGLAAALTELLSGPVTADSADDTVIVLACDLPRACDVVQLIQSAELGVDGTVLVDEQGWPQYLAGRYRLAALRDRMKSLDQLRDLSMRRFVGQLDLNLVPAPPAITSDIDTPDQAEALGINVHHPRRSPESDAENLAIVAQWQQELRMLLGVTQAPCDVDELLRLASIASKRVARPGVPVTAYCIGLAVGRALGSGADPQLAAQTAFEIAHAAAGARPVRPAK